VLGAGLRFTGLSWGLRHVPPQDERYFVENTGWMLARGDLDHRFYEYPGLLFYLLAPVLAFFEPPALGAPAYLAARAVVAGFGVASVVLVFRLGERVAGRGAGLAAALFQAVSPIEVQTAHQVRPDVVLEAFVLLALLAFERVGRDRRGDLLAGAAVGAATALKFSGLLLAPCYALRRLLAATPEDRSVKGAMGTSPRWGREVLWGRLLLAAAAAAGAFVLLSPYSLVHLGSALEGARTQLAYHYTERGRGPQAFAGMAWTYGLVLFRDLGAAGVALTLAGAALVLAEWRRWAPMLAFPFLTVAVFSTAEVHHDRFLVPALGLLAIVAARAVAAVGRRSGTIAVAVALLAAVHPLMASVDYVSGVSRPGTRDLALDWIESNLPAGSRILTSQRDLGIDRRRYEVLEAERLDRTNRLLALDVDAVVSSGPDDRDLIGELESLYIAEPATVHSGAPIRIVRAPSGRRSDYRRLELDPRWVTASESADRAPALVDRDLETLWRTEAAQRPGTWIEVSLPAPTTIARVELRLAGRRQFARNVHVYVAEDGAEWKRIVVLQGRPPVEEQLAGAGPSQLLLFEPVRVRKLRLVQVGQRERPWAVAELEVWGVVVP
jgi:hypothetical protein